MYGGPKMEELKMKHSFRLVGGAVMGSRGGEDSQPGSSWWTGWSHICVWINQEEQLGSRRDHATHHSSAGK